MVLQGSGAISLGNIQTEFGGTAPTALSEYYGKATGVPASGTIKFSDFYGKTNAPTWVTNAFLGSFAVGGAFNKTLQATASGPVTYSIVSYPTPAFGAISGSTFSGTVPSGKFGANVYTWTIAATSGGSTNKAFNMTVTSTAPVWSTGWLGTYYTNSSFGVGLSVSSDSSVTISIIGSPGFGYISGTAIYGTTPSYSSTFYWTLRATDAEGQISDTNVGMSVIPPVAPGWSAPRSFNAIEYIDCGYFPQGSYFYKNVGCDIGTPPIGYGIYNITIFAYDTSIPAVYGYTNLNPGFYYFTVGASNSGGSATVNFGFTVY